MVLLSHKFQRLWDDSTIEQQQAACRYVRKDDVVLLRKWIAEHPSFELGELGIRRLREIARKAGVRNYSRKDKSELIIAIQFKESDSGNKSRDSQ